MFSFEGTTMRIRSALASLMGLCFVLSAHAEESIALGKFLGEQEQSRLHASAIYSNSENSKASISLRMNAVLRAYKDASFDLNLPATSVRRRRAA